MFSPLLCFNSSTEQVRVNVSFRVMMGASLHLTGGRCRKDFSEKIFFGRIAHKPYGGKTGRAMIKYPHTKKNAQQENRSAYPGR